MRIDTLFQCLRVALQGRFVVTMLIGVVVSGLLYGLAGLLIGLSAGSGIMGAVSGLAGQLGAHGGGRGAGLGVAGMLLFGLAALVLCLLGELAWLCGIGAVAKLGQEQLVNGRKITVGEGLSFGARRLGSLLASPVMIGLALTIAVIVLALVVGVRQLPGLGPALAGLMVLVASVVGACCFVVVLFSDFTTASLVALGDGGFGSVFGRLWNIFSKKTLRLIACEARVWMIGVPLAVLVAAVVGPPVTWAMNAELMGEVFAGGPGVSLPDLDDIFGGRSPFAPGDEDSEGEQEPSFPGLSGRGGGGHGMAGMVLGGLLAGLVLLAAGCIPLAYFVLAHLPICGVLCELDLGALEAEGAPAAAAPAVPATPSCRRCGTEVAPGMTLCDDCRKIVTEEKREEAERLLDRRFALAQEHLQAHRLAEAVEELRVVVEGRPEDMQAWGYLGQALAAQGLRKDAVEAYQNGLAQDPNAVPLRIGLARVLEGARRLPEARDEYIQVLRIDPNSKEAREGLERVQRALGGAQ